MTRSGLRAACAALLALPLLAFAAAGVFARTALPPTVFVSRQRPIGNPSAEIPGFGPHGRSLAPGGRLMLRESDGRLLALLPEGVIFDVSRPAISPDGRRVAFAGLAAPESAWRILVTNLDGSGLAALTRSDRVIDLSPLGAAAGRFARYDDFDPCWVSDDEVWFASTRYPQRSQYADLPVTNLFAVRVAGGSPVRLTSERNGAESPSFDPHEGRVLFSRWWFNRWRAADHVPRGITTDAAQAISPDSINLWQAMEVIPAHDALGRSVALDERLAAGSATVRLGEMCYQPVALAGGSVVGVYARNLGLSPAPMGSGLQRFSPRLSPGRRLIGAAVGSAPGDPYTSARGLAPPSACSPAALPDGGLVFAYDPGARGDFGIWRMRSDGGGLEPVVDLPGTLELDPAPVLPRARRFVIARLATSLPALRSLPASSLDSLRATPLSFRFHNLGVFGARPGSGTSLDPRPATGARIRFFATLARPAEAGGDTAVLVREATIGAHGEVDESGLPADQPMFEQLVAADGRVMMAAHGPAHVAGLNAGPPGAEVRCIGCHAGHSTQLREAR